MISQNQAEGPLNITTTLNNHKSFIKQVYDRVRSQNIKKKTEQNNYFWAGISQKVEKVLTLKQKKADWLLIGGKIYFFSKIQFL